MAGRTGVALGAARPAVDVAELDAITADAPRSRTVRNKIAIPLARAVLVAALLGCWQFASGRWIDSFWISSPTMVADRLWEWLVTGFLWPHLSVTLQETALGLLVGLVTGVGAALLLAANDIVAKILDPLVVALYSVPKVALAPLFVLWFGIGIQMKVVLIATIVFFLIFWNVYAGIKDVDKELIDVLRVMGAKRWHLAKKVIFPGTLPWLYVGLKLSVPYALTGAVFAELISSNSGLGFVLSSSAGQFDIAGQFAGLLVLMVIALLLNWAVNVMERRLMRWKHAA